MGNEIARRDFLSRKVREEADTLSLLPQLPYQHALLLLRVALQQNLRHLGRTLKTDDLSDLLADHDEALWRTPLLFRAASHPTARDSALLKLPVKLGGLGILSFEDTAPLARAASQEAALEVLLPLFSFPELDRHEPEAQGTRTRAMSTRQHAALVRTLSGPELCMLAENASLLGRRWLSVIPYSQNLLMSDKEVSTALHARTLCSGTERHCLLCGAENVILHDEVCMKMENVRLARHEQLKKIFIQTLSQAARTTVTNEPALTRRDGDDSLINGRTDFRVRGSAAQGGQTEYDLTIISVGSQASRAAVNKYLAETAPRPGPDPIAAAQAALVVAAKAKEAKYRNRTLVPFKPLAMTTGGCLEAGAHETFMHWQETIGSYAFGMMLNRVSILLQRARTHTFRI